MGVIRIIIAFLIALIAATVLGVAFSAHFVLQGLVEIGAQISAADRWNTFAHDLPSFGPLYGVLLSIGFVIAFLVAAIVGRAAPLPRNLVFLAAGAVSVTVTLVLAEEVFWGVMPVGGARTTLGFIAQVVAGGVAGYLFARLTPPPKAA